MIIEQRLFGCTDGPTVTNAITSLRGFCARRKGQNVADRNAEMDLEV